MDYQKEILKWIKLGVGPEWAGSFFLPSNSVDVGDVAKCTARAIGTRVEELGVAGNYEASFWVLEMIDKGFLLVQSIYDEDGGPVDEDTLFKVSWGRSFEECLEGAQEAVGPEVIQNLIRDRCSKSLQL
jgi:hypothetical protein